MEYVIAISFVIVSFVSWCVGVRMGSNYVARRMVQEFNR